jgi:hypothetical protein
MKLSDQALGAVMLALQKSLMEQSDIVPMLKNFDFVITGDDQSELIVTNPPTVKFNNSSVEAQDA